MLKDVVVHLHNEQPLLADLFDTPSPSDTCVICTNLRTMGGKTPIFVENSRSTFLFPLVHVRFVEIRPDPGDGAEEAASASAGEAGPAIDPWTGGAGSTASRGSGESAPPPPAWPSADTDVGPGGVPEGTPGPGGPTTESEPGGGAADSDSSLDLDEELLRRIREA